jgi:hypothetical protein
MKSPKRERIADGLEINGGIVLLAGGIALIILACVFASEPTVAPVFAVFGASMLILGAFYSRIEGDVEATRKGVKATVRAVRRRAREQNLPDEIADEALDRALWSHSHPSTAWGNFAAEARAERAISEVQTEHERVVGAVAHWLKRDGYKVSRPAHGIDLVGSRDDGAVGVEVKVSLAIGVAPVRQVASFQLPTDSHSKFRRILVFPGHAGVSSDAQAEAARSDIELMTVDGQGNVTAFANE